MKSVSEKFKHDYNALLERENKLRLMIDNPQATEAQRNLWLNGDQGYMKVCERLSTMINWHKDITGVEMNSSTALNGFLSEVKI